MADIIHGDDLDKRALKDKDEKWRKCAICGGSASTGGAWLYAKHAVKKSDRCWKTTEVWQSHGEFKEGTPKKTGQVYIIQDRKDESHVLCVIQRMRHKEVRKWKK